MTIKWPKFWRDLTLFFLLSSANSLAWFTKLIKEGDTKTMTKPIFIAEVKTKSPFGWQSDKSWDELFAIANTHGDWLSVHTDPRWGGSMELIKKARKLTKKPILAKGIHAKDEEIEQAIAAGADYVLVVGRLPAVHLDQCLIEVLSLDQFDMLPTAIKAVWNQRDLATGKPKQETFQQARSLWPGWLAQASLIAEPTDVSPVAEAFIVATDLAKFCAKYTA